MSAFSVKKAIRLHLSTMPSVPATAYEAMSFDAPDDDVYLRLQFVVNTPDDPTLGVGYYRERITAQIFVVDSAGHGTGTAEQLAETIRQHFKKGTTLIQDGVRIQVLTTPQISGSVVLQNKLIIPVMINVVGEVFTA